MCKVCEQFPDSHHSCQYCTHWKALTAEAVRHHEDTEHPQLVMATLRTQLQMAQDLQRGTQALVEKLAARLTAAQEELVQQVARMEQINRTYTGVEE